jgi:hypothetical protein
MFEKRFFFCPYFVKSPLVIGYILFFLFGANTIQHSGIEAPYGLYVNPGRGVGQNTGALITGM